MSRLHQFGISMASSSIKSRIGHSQWALKPQDLAMAFKLALAGQRWPGYAELAHTMRLSPFEAHACVSRLQASGLVAEGVGGSPQLVMQAFRPMLMYGAPYFFPAVRGELTMGSPTAHAADPLKSMFAPTDDLPPVWPHEDGLTRGLALLPLYPKLPLAARDDPKLYELLALFDALRAGQARETKIARSLLEERLSGKEK